MKKIFNIIRKWPPCWWAVTYSVVLIGFTVLVLLSTFVIESKQVSGIANSGTDVKNTQPAALISDQSYKDSNIDIKLSKKRVNNTSVYIADIQVSSVAYLKAAFADNSYGRNIKQTTSEMAEKNKAILAINGDYYGFRDYGYVLRNGTLYRSNYGNSEDESFVVYKDGSCGVITESQQDAKSLLKDGAVQVFSFGPVLIENGKVSVGEKEEVDQARNSNPRTAIGMISPLHYVIAVSDGRTKESQGLTLYQLAQIMKDQGCTEAYNLDGGGSSTLYFNGKVINNPTDGRKKGEREVSDIVYIGY
ncbi:phosphodiester glycosidase family protein [Aminipila terrae]|uniref:Phosphodiester glycosidase family protein n=1 Tax=Aminipila terrae TaxID=2697030 RepID=A0A6P1MP55_9FIRM|nr:phosphodiester glycosidase family protein [Aminipila terrae]QHI72775.1 phosphodiester glycosidase family protein [Aminipila terrae]